MPCKLGLSLCLHFDPLKYFTAISFTIQYKRYMKTTTFIEMKVFTICTLFCLLNFKTTVCISIYLNDSFENFATVGFDKKQKKFLTFKTLKVRAECIQKYTFYKYWLWLKWDKSIKKISRNLPKTERIKIRDSILPHKIILEVNISHVDLITIVLSLFTLFSQYLKRQILKEKPRSDFTQHLFFPMLRCKPSLCNVDISYLKITVLIEEHHFFFVGAKKINQGPEGNGMKS